MKNEIENNNVAQISTRQNISGSTHRVAGRDYIEHLSIPSIDFMLMTEPKSALDTRAIANERFFKRRFKFQANEAVRQKLIDFQNNHGLTDAQIKNLYSVGLIHPQYNQLTIKSPRAVFYSGWLFTIILSLHFLLIVGAFIFSSHQSALAGITVLSSAFIYAGVMWLIDKRCIQPSRLLRHKQICRPITL